VDARGKVVVVGVGKSGHIGGKIASTLTSTGSPAVVLDSLNALHGDLGMVADGDVVLALSSSGETEELVRILPAITRFSGQDHCYLRGFRFHAREKRARRSRRKGRAGSLSIESGANFEHDGNAGARRCDRDGFVGSARI